jgi:putative transposase
MESFFRLLQKNVLDRQRWSSREQLRLAIITWTERTCHRRRRQRRLGRLTPIEYEMDRPGDLGGSDPWKDAESCLHSGSTPMSCVNAQ